MATAATIIWYGSNRRRQLFYGSRSIPCYRDFTYMIFTMLHDLFAKYLSSTTSRFSLSLYLSVSIRQIRGCLCPLPDLAKISNLKSQISNNICYRYRFRIAKFGSSPDIYDSVIRITFSRYPFITAMGSRRVFIFTRSSSFLMTVSMSL